MPKKWIPLESNPEVLNEFVTALGIDVSRYSFSDVFGLDEEMLGMVPTPVLAVLMCFPYKDAAPAGTSSSGTDTGLFYMKQTIGNACGTIAMMHGIGNNLNALSPGPGSFLRQFFDATAGLSPEAVGKYLEEPPGGAPDIEASHQAAAATGSSAAPSVDDDVALHYVAFVHKNGHLFELDGMQAGPVDHGSSSAETLLADTAKVVQKFVERTDNINFNLLALTATAY
ncbi:MAG: hypothetical protein WDW38_001536 [Sanguina aurantia]